MHAHLMFLLSSYLIPGTLISVIWVKRKAKQVKIWNQSCWCDQGRNILESSNHLQDSRGNSVKGVGRHSPKKTPKAQVQANRKSTISWWGTAQDVWDPRVILNFSESELWSRQTTPWVDTPQLTRKHSEPEEELQKSKSKLGTSRDFPRLLSLWEGLGLCSYCVCAGFHVLKWDVHRRSSCAKVWGPTRVWGPVTNETYCQKTVLIFSH